MHIALLAGEVSGDRLGAPLLKELKRRYPQAHFSGVGGAYMQAQGLEMLADMQRLAVMGFVEVVSRLPELYRIKNQLLHYWQQYPPDMFIGIDAPDFNLRIAAELHRRGVKTAHYVSPSLWAWKEKRIETIRRHIDIVLCLFPFETGVYDKNGVPAVCVGHPLSDRLHPITQAQARQRLQLPSDVPILGLFPGSRRTEIQRLLPVFLQTYQALKTRIPGLHAVLSLLQDIPGQHPETLPDIRICRADSADLISACDVILPASGTITLEAALLQRPMVVAYRVNPLTAAIAERLLKIRRFSLPNLLAQADLVPECIQTDCTPEKLCIALEPLLTDAQVRAAQLAGFARITAALPRQVSQRAADALRPYLES